MFIMWQGSDYEKYNIVRPNDLETPPSEKDSTYDLSWARYIYYQWVTGNGATKMSYEDMVENYRYWFGKQDVGKYKQYMYKDKKRPSGLSTFGANGEDLRDQFKAKLGDIEDNSLKFIDFNQIASPATNIRNSLQGMLVESDRLIRVKMTDLNSMNKEEKNKWTRWNEAINKDLLDEIYSNMGAEGHLDNIKLPSSLDELQLMENDGEFRLNYAKEAQKLLRHTEKISNYDELYEKIIDSLACTSIAIKKVYLDNVDNKIKYNILDPRNSFIENTQSGDFSDSSFGGTWMLMKVADLAKRGIETKDLIKVARQYAGAYNNPSLNALPIVNPNGTSNTNYLNCIVPVLYIAWKDIDIKSGVIYQRLSGDKVYRKKDKAKGKNEKLIKNKIVKIREAYWVRDTDIVFDNGVMNNMVREKIQNPLLPFVAVRMDVAPLVTVIKPFLDDFNISWLFYLRLKYYTRFPSIEVNFDLLKGIPSDNGTYSEMEALDMWLKKGVLPKSLINSDFKPGTSSPRAIDIIEGGMGRLFSEIVNSMNFALQMLEQSTGLSLNSIKSELPNEGDNPNTEKQLIGISNSLKPLVDKSILLKEKASNYALLLIQLGIKYYSKTRDSYKEVIGDIGVSLLKEAIADKARFGAFMDNEPIVKMKRDLMAIASGTLTTGKDGRPTDYLYILELINNGEDPIETRKYIKNLIEKREAERRKEAMDTQKYNTEAHMQKNKSDMEKIQFEEQTRASLQEKRDYILHKYKLEEIDKSKTLDKDREKIEQSGQPRIINQI